MMSLIEKIECSSFFDWKFFLIFVHFFSISKYQKVKYGKLIISNSDKSRRQQHPTPKWTGSWKAKRNQNTRHQVNLQKYSGRRQKSLESTRRSQLHSQRAVNSYEEDGKKGESMLFQWIWTVDKCGASLMMWERERGTIRSNGETWGRKRGLLVICMDDVVNL